ncbi:hypothetical protein GALL_460680 [mine drainage metagenome]|uniref:Uncharacterized protein n=1 Tax=mine drainage metagenome TaxID=410659 RepID=A0A1J5PMC1_9ZZZZ
MLGALRKPVAKPAPSAPVLDLSGPRLRRAFEHLVESADPTGGVERYVTALALKASLFEELLGKGHVETLTETEFLDLAAFITPVRRKVGLWLGSNDFQLLRDQLVVLLSGWSDVQTADIRIARFVTAFPQDKAHRWTRDLAAEVLHYIAPDRYPLMTRWVWDAKTTTGALREIWFADDVATVRINAPDDYLTFATLTAEIEGFLRDQGVFRDIPFYTDVLLSHVYAGYINDRGGSLMRAEFATSSDPMLHTRRMLGLDSVDTETGRTRLKLIDGTAHVLGQPKAVTYQETD